jgi:choline dehydrogenase
VILSGGAINSPQLLMLSGIGPADHLRSLGIETVADRPGVGANLQDHPIVGMRWLAPDSDSLKDAETPLSVARYVLGRRGMLSSNVAEAGLFAQVGPGTTPDIQFHVAPVLFSVHGFEPPRAHGFSLGPTLVRPESRGAIRLRSADPAEHPAIDPNYFAEPADVDRLVDALQLAREIVAQPAYNGIRGDETGDGAGVTSREGLAEHVRRTAETLYHPIGTCRMGPDEDSVVDLDLRVRGVDGLRVVDASVMPEIPNGNTHAPTVMIAERAADLILGHATRAASAQASGDGAAQVLAQDLFHA